MKVLKKFVDFADVATAVVVGYTEAGDMILDAGFFVTEVFNGTTPVMDMGFAADNQGGSADPNALMSAVALTALGNKAADELAAATNLICTAGDSVTATFSVAGGTPTTGKGFAWVRIINSHPHNPN